MKIDDFLSWGMNNKIVFYFILPLGMGIIAPIIFILPFLPIILFHYIITHFFGV